MSSEVKSVHLVDEAALDALAKAWAKPLCKLLRARGSGDAAIMTLEGELGAGKSTLVRSLLRALGYQGAVPSPTYTLIESYSLDNLRVAHADLYRLADPEELEFLDFADVLAEHDLVCIEWPDRAGDRLPDAELVVRLEYHPQGGRQLFFSGPLAQSDLTTSL